MEVATANSDIRIKTATSRNACKLCAPLGASVVYKGIKGCIPLIHGSQGCSTYIRRYLISHYKEPIDIASTNFNEEAAVFGGRKNFLMGVENIVKQYNPEVVALASSCLSETIGDDVSLLISEYQRTHEKSPVFINASTPSYRGTHMMGFHQAVHATVAGLAKQGVQEKRLNIFPGFISPADIRHIKEIVDDFGVANTILPDYSETFDNPNWDDYKLIPPGGTTVNEIAGMPGAMASIEFGTVFSKEASSDKKNDKVTQETGAGYLQRMFFVKNYSMAIPMGINQTDKLMDTLSEISGNPMPEKYAAQRGRLVDAYVDGHKYIFGKKAIIYGEEDFVISLAAFLFEIGIVPVLCASGGESGNFANEIKKVAGDKFDKIKIIEGADFEEIRHEAKLLEPDIMIGHSKGYYIARELEIPIVRIGFPIHDRVGGQRMLHIGYDGAQRLFDTITNTIIEYKQDKSPVGYKYM